MSKCKDLILSVIKPWFPYDTNTFLPLPAVLTDDRIELNIPTSTLKTQELMFLWLWRSRGRSSVGINCLHWSYENLHHLPQLRYNLGCIYCTAQFQEDRFSKTENTMDSPCLPLCLAIMNDYCWVSFWSSYWPAQIMLLEASREKPLRIFIPWLQLALPASQFQLNGINVKRSQSPNSPRLRLEKWSAPSQNTGWCFRGAWGNYAQIFEI